MACIENIPPTNGDSEMEEGEIIDELDDLSDISSEEEFLLRQRLEVLENYNNVLERKKAKNSTVGSGKNKKHVELLLQDLSEISVTDNEEYFAQMTSARNNHERHIKPKRKKCSVMTNFVKNKDTKKRSHRVKKKLMSKVVDSSEESDDEYRNKRRKLANAVVVNTPKADTTTLRARLKKMFGTQSQEPIKAPVAKVPDLELNSIFSINSSTNSDNIEEMNTLELEKPLPEEIVNAHAEMCEFIDLCNDDEVTNFNNEHTQDTNGNVIEKNDLIPTKATSGDSDEDLELLRQHALKTKTSKVKNDQLHTNVKGEPENKHLVLSEDEDSDTAELRLICLKSALLKKAIEMKQKKKLRKRLSQSMHDDLIIDDENILRKNEAENNTDIESVDMDIGSDGDEKLKEISDQCVTGLNVKHETEIDEKLNVLKNIPIPMSPQKDELDEDEDLLRAELLTSLSKNWPNLVDPTVVDVPSPEITSSKAKSKSSLPVEKPFIIKLGESDSEGEHEATKNLTKMHIKLSEQIDFQQKLDLFLKSTRMEVEKQTLPDVVQQPPELAKVTPKYVPKTVRHLPKSEQIEYKNLVKRMAELEKIKQARQISMNSAKSSLPKDTLKPRNVAIDITTNTTVNHLDQQIAISRKKIAEESAKILKLKEEATKLSQKYKIAATELRNIATAITFNKKEQRSVQIRLTKIRLQHESLIKSSSSNKHSKTNVPLATRNNNKNLSSSKLQKENNPSKEEYKNPQLLKSVKVSVANDLKEENAAITRLSVQIDVANNKKIVKRPKSPPKERTVDFIKHLSENISEANNQLAIIERDEGRRTSPETRSHKQSLEINNKDIDDYKSPLEALHSGKSNYRRTVHVYVMNFDASNDMRKGNVYTSYSDAIWEEDPNSFLCPFEVGGSCKDPDCKYLHPKIPTDQ